MTWQRAGCCCGREPVIPVLCGQSAIFEFRAGLVWPDTTPPLVYAGGVIDYPNSEISWNESFGKSTALSACYPIRAVTPQNAMWGPFMGFYPVGTWPDQVGIFQTQDEEGNWLPVQEWPEDAIYISGWAPATAYVGTFAAAMSCQYRTAMTCGLETTANAITPIITGGVNPTGGNYATLDADIWFDRAVHVKASAGGGGWSGHWLNDAMSSGSSFGGGLCADNVVPSTCETTHVTLAARESFRLRGSSLTIIPYGNNSISVYLTVWPVGAVDPNTWYDGIQCFVRNR